MKYFTQLKIGGVWFDSSEHTKLSDAVAECETCRPPKRIIDSDRNRYLLEGDTIPTGAEINLNYDVDSLHWEPMRFGAGETITSDDVGSFRVKMEDGE